MKRFSLNVTATLFAVTLSFSSSKTVLASGTAEDGVAQQLKKVEALREQDKKHEGNCPTCQVSEGGGPIAKCTRFYQSLYKDPTLKVFVGFGYGDYPTDPAPEFNSYNYADFVQKLTKPCISDSKFCGFTRAPDDATRFRKKILINGQSRTIEVTAMKAAASNPSQQDAQSERVTAAFNDAIKTSQVVLYAGHSREGGGPDFNVARRLPNQKIDFRWYIKNKPGISGVFSGMDETHGKNLSLYGSISCDSKVHFLKDLLKHSPDTVYALTTRYIQSTEFTAMLGSVIDVLQNPTCETGKRPAHQDGLDLIGLGL